MDNCEGNVLASSENAGIKAATTTHDGLIPPHNHVISMQSKYTDTRKNTNLIPDMCYNKNSMA